MASLSRLNLSSWINFVDKTLLCNYTRYKDLNKLDIDFYYKNEGTWQNKGHGDSYMFNHWK